jgi:protein-disulfide isomerase
MDSMQPIPSSTKPNLFDLMPSKTAFWVGFGTAILSLGTLGFIILGTCVLKGNCDIGALAQAEDSAEAGDTAPTAAAPSAVPKATTTVGDIAELDKDDRVQGDANAAITIVEYSDFQCPFCSRFHPTLEQMMTDYAGKIRWVYRHFPLSFHEEAQNAAEAAECAGEQGKFWEYADKLFSNQSTLGEELYKKLATELALNTSQFDSCRSSDKYLAKIANDEKEGAAAGVTGTPGTFIYKTDAKDSDQAIVIKGAQSASSVKAAIDSLLK